MPKGKKHTAEQVVNLLRQIEVAVANGKTIGQACKEALIAEVIRPCFFETAVAGCILCFLCIR